MGQLQSTACTDHELPDNAAAVEHAPVRLTLFISVFNCAFSISSILQDREGQQLAGKLVFGQFEGFVDYCISHTDASGEKVAITI